MAYGQRGGNVLSGILASISFVSFGILLNQGALAVNSQIDRVQLAVPVSCNVNTTYDTAHTATITNGTYTPNIGTTTFKVLCNDSDGFSIYAIGYSNETYGNNKLLATIGGVLNPTYDIVTGTAESGNTSNWAMKINAVTGTYRPTITGEEQGDTEDFTDYHNVPTEYTKVATFTSNTDMTIGSSIQSTYATYIANNQPAGTYAGKVKYTLVHPASAPEPVNDNQIGIIYDSNGLTFPGGLTTNRVVYEESCEDEYGYISDTPFIQRTSNLDANGNQSGSYSRGYDMALDGDNIYDEDAYGFKVEIEYKVDIDTSIIYYGENDSSFWYCSNESEIGCEGTRTFFVSGNYVSMYYDAYNETDPNYDYGFYIKAYPVYSEAREGTTYGLVRENVCTINSVSGTYTETTTWNDYWYSIIDGNVRTFYSEEDVAQYLENYGENLNGTTIYLYAGNTYTVIFDANGGSGTMGSQQLFIHSYNTLNTNTFTKSHQDVISWNTKADGTGERYTLGARVSAPISNTNAGGSVTLYAQWGACTPGKICYEGNGASNPSGMDKQTPPSYSSSSNLWPSNYQRQNYGFAGWNTQADGTGTNYGPTQIVNTNNDFKNIEGIRLYAKWVPSAGNLQNWSGCSSMNIGDVTALTDTRDNNTYAVARLADGNCWMIENLRLGSTTEMTLTTLDTESAGTLPAATSTSGARSLRIENVSSPVTTMTNINSNIYSYGVYYGWRTAINTNTIPPAPDRTVNTSICPAGGWHLPYAGGSEGGGTSSGGFSYLLNNVGASNLMNYPNNFIYNLTYWSATSGSYSNATYVSDYCLSVSSSSSSVSNYRETSSLPVRCVLNASN